MESTLKNLQEKKSVFLGAAQSNDNRLSGDLVKSINEGKVYFSPKTHYVKKDISEAGGLTRILDTTTKRVDGISTFNENKLPKKEAMVYDQVRIAYGKGDEAKLSSTKLNKAFDEALLNANLIIKQNGRIQLEAPVSDFHTEGTNTDVNSNYVQIPVPNLIRDDEELEISLQFPKGSAMPAASSGENHFVGIYLRGVVTR